MLVNTQRNVARVAGVLYLLGCLPAPFVYFGLPAHLIVPGDPLATADRIRASEMVLRLALGAELLNPAVVLLAVLMLHRLFKAVDAGLAMAMVALTVPAVAISYANALNHVALLLLSQSTGPGSAFAPGQVAALMGFYLRLHAHGVTIAQVFWAVWMIPYSLLIMRSGFIPRALGYPLWFACAGYLFDSAATILLPRGLHWLGQYGMVLGVGELPIVAWLILWGVREPKTPAGDWTGAGPVAGPRGLVAG